MRYKKRNARSILAVWAATVLAACGPMGIGDSQDDKDDNNPATGISAVQAEQHLNEALVEAVNTGDTVVYEDSNRLTLDGSVSVGDGAVAFANLRVNRAPFELTGTATVEIGAHSAEILFTGTASGSVEIDGEVVEILANLPLNSDFGFATAMLILGPYMAPGVPATNGAADCSNLTVTDNGNGTITIDGDCTVGDFTIDFDNVVIDAVNGTIDGDVTITDGNGDVLLLIEFNGNTATVFDGAGNELGSVVF